VNDLFRKIVDAAFAAWLWVQKAMAFLAPFFNLFKKGESK